MTDTPLRYADYSRVSSQMQADRELSIPAQQREIKDYAKTDSRQWLHAASFEDKAISGMTTDRPGLQAMLGAARRREFDILIIHKMDRLSREELDFLVVKAELKKYGIGIASVTEPFAGGTHPMDEMMETMSRGFAKLYISNLRREIKKGMREASEQGRQNAHPPYGYCYKDLTKRGNGWQVDPDRGAWAARLFARFQDGDLTMIDFTIWVNAQEFPLPLMRGANQVRRSSAGWNPVTLRRILRSRNYIGEVVHQGVWRAGVHPPLVAREMFDAVQRVLNVRGQSGNEQRRRDNAAGKNGDGKCCILGGGLMRCPLCEAAGVSSTLIIWAIRKHVLATGREASYAQYNCAAWSQSKVAVRTGGEWTGHACPGYRISEQKVMALLTAALREIAQMGVGTQRMPVGGILAKAVRPARMTASTPPMETPEILTREIDQVTALRARYQEMAAKGLMTDEELSAALDSLTRRRAGLEERREKAETNALAESLSPVAAQTLLSVLENKANPSVMRRDRLRMLIERIVPWPDKSGLTIIARQSQD